MIISIEKTINCPFNIWFNKIKASKRWFQIDNQDQNIKEWANFKWDKS